jgi:hypothetical protein
MLQTKFSEKIKTHILYSITLFFENRTVYEVMWKSSVEPGRPQKRIWRMRIACWIPKATNTFRMCNKSLISFPLQHRLPVRASMLCCTYSACIVLSNIRTVCFL